MAKAASSVQVKEGTVVTLPADFANAIELVRRKKIPRLRVRYDFLDKKPKPPQVDLALLRKVPFIEDFSISEMSYKRLANFEAIYELAQLEKLGMYAFKQLDLSQFPKLETLLVTDAPGLTGLESLPQLRYARIWKLRTDALSFLPRMPRLSELSIIQSPIGRLRGLDGARALAKLELSHCSKLESIDALPKGLVTLKIMRCPKLRDLSFVKGHPSLEFLFVDVMESVAFVPGLRRINYVGFQNVVDGKLQPLLESASLSKVGFYPGKRHYTHSESEINEALADEKK